MINPSVSCSRVVAGISNTSLPSSTSTAVSGRLARARDNASANEIKWPELLDKFKQTQERARRRNERLLRGAADADTAAGPGSGSVTRSFLDGDGMGLNGGRSSRASLRDGDDKIGRAGNAPGKPHGTTGSAGSVKVGSGMSISGAGAGHLGGVAGADRLAQPHKRGHSLAGGFGKFASGIARAGGSRDREKKK